METINFLLTGVGGQGTVLAGDIMSAVGLAAGYDVKKSDIQGLAVRGGGVLGHVRWGEKVYSPIVPEGRADFLIGFEVLEGVRWLDQVKPDGVILLNQQKIYPVTVAAGTATYPSDKAVLAALASAVDQHYSVPGTEIALQLGNARVLNIIMLGMLSCFLKVEPTTWEKVLGERIKPKLVNLNLQAFQKGREWMLTNRKQAIS
jgi:indolepyruvate ferredoxin oxidoreductase, beta subunit